jgi:hypothetical protein
MTKVKRRDRRFLMWRVKNPETGEIQDLTGSTNRLLVREQYSDEDATPYAMTIEGDPTEGIVKYWYDGTIAAGTYEIEVETTTAASNTIITSPTEGYNILLVEADLG